MQTVKGYCCGFFVSRTNKKLRNEIRKKRRGKLAKIVLFQQGNASTYSYVVAKPAVRDADGERLEHSPYSFDLIPSESYFEGRPNGHRRLGTIPQYHTVIKFTTAINPMMGVTRDGDLHPLVLIVHSESRRCVFG
ncbi:hypothetical protein EVAR_39957_1 [Eumeta japonica]|uniref:Mariner Mos1 transposase n=1 Tax=Eumeta variegata TaxID=151549 RepID=A0A4C1X0N8_EUMVA|nr:hypothetical protein EVAR_39957_1 [Eumeta japonica]